MKEVVYIETEEQVAAISSDLRMQVLQCFKHGEASIAELAERLGRSPQSLYHHIHKLVDAGVVVEHSVRRVGKRDETLYAPAAMRVELRHEPAKKKSRAALTKIAHTVLRLTRRDIITSIDAGMIKKSGRGRNTQIGRADALLSRSQVQRIHDLLDEVWAIMREDRSAVGASAKRVPMTMTTAFFPSPHQQPAE